LVALERTNIESGPRLNGKFRVGTRRPVIGEAAKPLPSKNSVKSWRDKS